MNIGVMVLETDCALSPMEFNEETVYVYGLPLITCESIKLFVGDDESKIPSL